VDPVGGRLQRPVRRQGLAGARQRAVGDAVRVRGDRAGQLGAVGDALGERWSIVDPGVSIKRYPCCGATLRAIDAALALREEHAIGPEQIERVVLDIAPDLLETVRFCAPSAGFQGKFSLDYCVASALLDGRVDLDTFSDRSAARPELRQLLARVDRQLHPEWNTVESRRRSPVTVCLTDGRAVSKEVEHPRGSPANPITHDELLAKYRACASRALPASQVERSIVLFEQLDRLDDLNELIAALTVPVLVAA
jgi:2-methylcitrate dehydratase PrpD